MARSRRTRPSRVLLLVVAIAVAGGSAFEIHRIRASHPQASAAPLMATAPVVAPSQVAAGSTTRPVVMGNITRADMEAKGIICATPVVNSIPAVAQPLPAVTSTTNLMAQAKNAETAGDLLTARKVLNDALLAGALSPADIAAAKKQISTYNQTIVFSSRKFADDPFGGTVTVEPGQRLSSIANTYGIPFQLLQQLNNLSDPKKLRSGQHLKIIKGPMSLVVSKGAFNMDIYIGPPGEPGSMYLTSYPVGLGKSDSTPTGSWIIANKVKHPTYYSPRGEGVIASDDPKNPLGPCWMGLEGTNGKAVGAASYGIHGTIEPDSIGKMSSMGCIRMHNEDALVVFALLVEGKSTVVVKD